MTREDLVAINAGIVSGVVKEVVKHSPNCVILMMTNPLDTMTYLAYKLSGFPRERVIGQAGVLDGGRMKTFIAMETGLDPENIHTTVLGGHGDEMVPLVRFSSIGGIPLTHFLSRSSLTASSRAPATAAPRSCAISRPAAHTMRRAPRPARWPRRSPGISITSTLRRCTCRVNTGSKTSASVSR